MNSEFIPQDSQQNEAVDFGGADNIVDQFTKMQEELANAPRDEIGYQKNASITPALDPENDSVNPAPEEYPDNLGNGDVDAPMQNVAQYQYDNSEDPGDGAAGTPGLTVEEGQDLRTAGTESSENIESVQTESSENIESVQY